MAEESAWQTGAFADRVRELRRTKLRDLYPSEAWSLCRIIPEVDEVLDLCCGGDHMYQALRTLNAGLKYTGVDLNADLMRRASETFGSEHVSFINADLFAFLESCDRTYECVMAWAAVTHFPDMYSLIDHMIRLSSRYVLFDIRLTDTEHTVADVKMAWTEYGGVRHPFYLGSAREFFAYLRERQRAFSAVEIVGYDFPVGSTAWVSADILQPGVFSVVLEKRPERGASGETDWFLRMPPVYFDLIECG